MAVPRDAPLRFDESYGGEDCVFCADATGGRPTRSSSTRASTPTTTTTARRFAGLRRQQRRIAYGIAALRRDPAGGPHKRVFFSRVPIHHFALLRLPKIYRRLRETPELR